LQGQHPALDSAPEAVGKGITPAIDDKLINDS
jgi:hypothetical protein